MSDFRPPAPTAERTILVDPDQLLAVLEGTRRMPPIFRPGAARRLLVLALANLCPTTGVVQLTRNQLAELLAINGTDVSLGMATLERLGALRIEPRPATGHGRTAPRIAYRINPALAWAGSAEARARWADLPPPRDRRTRGPDR